MNFNLCAAFKKCSEPSNKRRMQKKTFDATAMMIGESKVGKSSILDAINNQNFNPSYRRSQNYDYQNFKLDDEGTKTVYNFKVWEVNCVFHLINLKSAKILFYVFAFDDLESFNSICKYRQMQTFSSPLEQTFIQKPIEFMVGNKSDIQDKAVDSKVAQEYSLKHDMIYIETSCLNMESIKNLIGETIQNLNNMTQIQHSSNSQNKTKITSKLQQD
ncbi:Ras family small GTPase (macronuclear) [Tetrahymena thermophila SB210]|uniref:Ras family small GTPase n=2 Tax=Tetrahymena thermophila TaxID=5911 RepID=Q22V51_TETTS|nr:Ras family small GTPase [Tetrahymena thermophila SB210]EAR89097.1 Ras family small GTPase [Tetrahymena thermophila SB210]BAJ21344.1 Rab-family small GTPase RabX29 [Tetrahymena thermophila]|eukprot:XP_001009342.1 Ras family small GTPase [Tetrahymena thermophila SB210]